MILIDRSIMPFGPHAGKIMAKVPAAWLEEFVSTAHDATEENDAVFMYVQVNRRRIDAILDAQESHA